MDTQENSPPSPTLPRDFVSQPFFTIMKGINSLIFRSATGILLAMTTPGGAQAATEPATGKAGEKETVAVTPGEAAVGQGVEVSRRWMQALQAGKQGEGLDAWAKEAFHMTARSEIEARLVESAAALGKLKAAYPLEDRSMVDAPPVLGPGQAAGETTVTVTWFCEYERGAQREYVVMRRQADGGLKIIGVRHQEAAVGSQAAVDLAADIGQMVLLRLNRADRSRWEPFLMEAKWLAEQLKIKLPEIPMEDVLPEEVSEEAGQSPLMELLTATVNGALQPVGPEVQAAGRTLLQAFALLSIYDPGDTMCAKLAGLIGESAKMSKLPNELWHPLIRAVLDKAPRSRISEIVHGMALEVSAHFAEKEKSGIVAKRAAELLTEALKNMSSLTAYQVRAELTSGEKTAWMEGTLDVDFMDLRLTGFDGKKQCRQVTPEDGARISTDDGVTWAKDTDEETVIGLCRTLTSPVDPGFKVVEKNQFTITGEEVINGEKLLHLTRTGHPEDQPMEYWILISKRGPVVRRARVTMNFGDLKAVGILTYTKLRGYADAAAAEAARKAMEDRLNKDNKKLPSDDKAVPPPPGKP